MQLMKFGLASCIMVAAVMLAESAFAHETRVGPFSPSFADIQYNHGSGSTFRARRRSLEFLNGAWRGKSAPLSSTTTTRSGGGRVTMNCTDASGFPGFADSDWVSNGTTARAACGGIDTTVSAAFWIRD